MAQQNAIFGEIERLLVQLGVPEDLRTSVMALIRNGARRGGEPVGVLDPEFAIRVARTFYKTALRATQALETSSISTVIMLLELFVAHGQNRPVSVSSLCIASGAASTTALRQIGQLEAQGYVTRRGDAQDRRRSWVLPTPRALDLIRLVVTEWSAVVPSK